MTILLQDTFNGGQMSPARLQFLTQEHHWIMVSPVVRLAQHSSQPNAGCVREDSELSLEIRSSQDRTGHQCSLQLPKVLLAVTRPLDIFSLLFVC